MTFDEFKNTIKEDYTLALICQKIFEGNRTINNSEAHSAILWGKEIAILPLIRYIQPDDFLTNSFRDIILPLQKCCVNNSISELLPRIIAEGKCLKNCIAEINIDHIQNNSVLFSSFFQEDISDSDFLKILMQSGEFHKSTAFVIWDELKISENKRDKNFQQSRVKALMKCFERSTSEFGISVYRIKSWNYPELYEKFEQGIAQCRSGNMPVIFFIEDLPDNSDEHKTTLSNIEKMKEFILSSEILTEGDLAEIEKYTQELHIAF